MVPKTPNISISNKLIPDRNTQPDLFICDVADAILKDIIPSMEYPFYSLSKKPDREIRRYDIGSDWVEIVPSIKGIATIYDKDILIYCISHLIAKKNAGEQISKRIRLIARDLLKFTNRGTAGKDYNALCEALDRLDGTRIRTNVRRDDEEIYNAFGLIDSAAVARKFGLDGRLLWCEVVLSDWVFAAVDKSEVLTLHRDYFRLRKPLERRIYEIARKHCGRQKKWTISIEKLLVKTGSQSSLKKFRQLLGDLFQNNHLPDYSVELDDDKVIFTNRGTMEKGKQEVLPLSVIGRLKGETYDAARQAAPGWCPYGLEDEWRSYCASKQLAPPRNPDAAFIGFCAQVFQRRGRP